MASCHLFLVFFITTCFATTVWTLEPFCVANLSLPANSDGFYTCKDPMFVNVNDFLFSRLRIPKTTTKKRERISTIVSDRQLPGLNTLGISMLLFDFASGDYVPQHIHHKGTEILAVLKGTILISFNASVPKNRQFTKVVRKGGVFVVPKGLSHSVKNVGQIDATVIAAFNCQDPDITSTKSSF